MKELAEKIFVKFYLRESENLGVGAISDNMAGAWARQAIRAAGAFELEIKRLEDESNDG